MNSSHSLETNIHQMSRPVNEPWILCGDSADEEDYVDQRRAELISVRHIPALGAKAR